MRKVKLFPGLEWLPGYPEGLFWDGGGQRAKGMPSQSPEPEMNRKETVVSLMHVLFAHRNPR